MTVSNVWLSEGVAAYESDEELLSAYKLRVGDRPFARSIRALYEKNKRKLPPDVAALRGETYIVTHGVGLFASKKANAVVTLGFSAQFSGPGATVDLFPRSSFKEYLAARGKFEAGIAADGSAKLPEGLGALSSETLNIGADASIQVGVEASVVGKVSLSIVSPKIQAVGTGASRVEWQFERDEHPLVGDQVMLQTIVVPKGQATLEYTVQGYAVIRTGPLDKLNEVLFAQRPRRLETKPQHVSVDLA